MLRLCARARQCWSPICSSSCYRTEDRSNNFIAIRRPPGSPSGNVLYAEFQTGDLTTADIKFDRVDFTEFYNLTADPWQMHNLAGQLPKQHAGELHQRLHMWLGCAGVSCP